MIKLTVDAELCTGHGRCYTVAPDLLTYDDEGFVTIRGQTIDVPGRAGVGRPRRRDGLPGGRHHDRGDRRVVTASATANVEVAPVRAGEQLDWDRLEAYLRAQRPSSTGRSACCSSRTARPT